MSRLYLQHGRRHVRGSDDVPYDWIYVGDTATAWDSGTSYSLGDIASHDVFNYVAILASTNVEPNVTTGWRTYWRISAPFFQNSWTNSGGSKVPLRYAFIVGVDPTTDQPRVELEGSVTGGVTGTTVFTLPITFDYDRHRPASDDAGGFVVFTVQQSGDVVYGFV